MKSWNDVADSSRQTWSEASLTRPCCGRVRYYCVRRLIQDEVLSPEPQVDLRNTTWPFRKGFVSSRTTFDNGGRMWFENETIHIYGLARDQRVTWSHALFMFTIRQQMTSLYCSSPQIPQHPTPRLPMQSIITSSPIPQTSFRFCRMKGTACTLNSFDSVCSTWRDCSKHILIIHMVPLQIWLDSPW